jgi:hypothetical protein
MWMQLADLEARHSLPGSFGRFMIRYQSLLISSALASKNARQAQSAQFR